VTATLGVEDLLRELTPQALGAVARRYGSLDDAEDAVQEALQAAATQWPAEGMPDHPLGWLIAVAARRMGDRLRRDEARRRREAVVVSWDPAGGPPPVPERDDSLTLLFLCCHPALTPGSAIPLTLRAVGGLTTAEIARAQVEQVAGPGETDVVEPAVARRFRRHAALVLGVPVGAVLRSRRL
jgi:predicted RNA polymerase sigma factor